MAARPLPPGPKGNFIGNLRPREFLRDPLGFAVRLARDYGDIVYLRWLSFPFYFLNHPDYIESVLVTHHRSVHKGRELHDNRLLFGKGLLTSEGDFWLRQRRLSQPAFHRDRIAAYGDVMVKYAQRMLAGWQDGETRDVYADMMRVTLENAARTLIDMEAHGETGAGDALLALLAEDSSSLRTVLRLPGHLPTPADWRLRREVRRLDAIIYAVIRERHSRERDTGDLLSMLMNARDEDGSRMTDQQLRDEAVTILHAGFETTAIALSWTWYLLSQHPRVEAELMAELHSVLGGRPPSVADLPQLRYTEMVFQEVMRLFPPSWGLTRLATQECAVGGYLIPKGASLAVSQWVMHRDPRYFDDPEAFYPERWADGLEKRLPRFAYFPFGGGPRLCIGKAFALMEGVLLLATIAQAFKLTLAPGQHVTPHPSLTLRPRDGVRMILYRRS
jgi:cytochrome P450